MSGDNLRSIEGGKKDEADTMSDTLCKHIKALQEMGFDNDFIKHSCEQLTKYECAAMVSYEYCDHSM